MPADDHLLGFILQARNTFSPRDLFQMHFTGIARHVVSSLSQSSQIFTALRKWFEISKLNERANYVYEKLKT